MMSLPHKIRPLTPVELEQLTVNRLLAYRHKALRLENSQSASDFDDIAKSLDRTYIWFKDDPRWQPLYDSVLKALDRK